jgi:hypothetical protein
MRRSESKPPSHSTAFGALCERYMQALSCRASPHQKHGRRGRRRSGRVASGLCPPQVKLCHLAYAYRHQFGADASPQAPRLAKSTSMIPSTRMGTAHLGTCPIPPRIPRSVASSASVTNLCDTFREVIELAHFQEHSMNQTAQDHAYLYPCSKRPPCFMPDERSVIPSP